MSDVIFNVADKNPYDCMYYDTYGYRACLNGKPFGIGKWDTVLALRQFGLPELRIPDGDVGAFEKCIYGEIPKW